MAEKVKKVSKDGKRARELVEYHIGAKLERALDEVDRLLAPGNVDLKLNFAECAFITVEGLEWLEEMLLRAQSLKAEVSFVNVVPTVYKVFKVAHIDDIMQACGAPVLGPAC